MTKETDGKQFGQGKPPAYPEPARPHSVPSTSSSPLAVEKSLADISAEVTEEAIERRRFEARMSTLRG